MEFGGKVGVCARGRFAVVELEWLRVSVPVLVRWWLIMTVLAAPVADLHPVDGDELLWWRLGDGVFGFLRSGEVGSRLTEAGC